MDLLKKCHVCGGDLCQVVIVPAWRASPGSEAFLRSLGQPTYRPEYKRIRAGRRYCSDACRQKGRYPKVYASRLRKRLQRAVSMGYSKIVDLGECITYAPVRVPCQNCGVEFEPERSTARFCSARCRMAAHRAGAKQ
jgi:hypothetical protein